MSEWNKYKITAEQFEKDILKLVNMISKRNHSYKGLYPIPRGGMVVGVYLSHYLDLPIIYNWHEVIKTKNVLIVDDILDTGYTLETFEDNFHTAVVYYKPRSMIVPTYFAEQIPDDRWIVFPFEKFDEEPNREI